MLTKRILKWFSVQISSYIDLYSSLLGFECGEGGRSFSLWGGLGWRFYVTIDAKCVHRNWRTDKLIWRFSISMNTIYCDATIHTVWILMELLLWAACDVDVDSTTCCWIEVDIIAISLVAWLWLDEGCRMEDTKCCWIEAVVVVAR